MVHPAASTFRSQPQRLVDQVNHLRSTLARDRVDITDMSRAPSLEAGIGTEGSADASGEANQHPVAIQRLEGPIVAREIECDTNPVSGFRFFLDGAQRTMPVCRIGLSPVVVAISAVGVLNRDGSGQPALQGDLLCVNQAWVVTRDRTNRELEALVWRIEEAGGTVVDLDVDGLTCGDYGRSLARAYDLARRLRADREREVLDEWERLIAPGHPGNWIAVDGRLRRNVVNAVGIVKDLQTQLLEGSEAIALFDLPKGHRTSAFRYASTSRHEFREEATGRTMWYMRLWPATGLDARHALVRIEAPNWVGESDQIDEISRWIMAERMPRATDDPRWPTLLYPISYLERILKRRLAAITAGWPSA